MTDFDAAFFGRMRDHLEDEFDWFGMGEEDTVPHLMQAFEAAKNPPKPDEPMGLGAVVEDTAGARWVRVGSNLDNLPQRWAEHGNIAEFRDWVRYADIDVIRVLSEGVDA